MNLLEVKTCDLKAIRNELETKIKKAPAFFQNCPVVLGFELLDEDEHDRIDLKALVALCQSLTLHPAATRGGNNTLQTRSNELGLACLAKGREKHMGVVTETPATQPPDAEPATAPAAVPTKVITHPIRSGQQVYAPGGDLVVLAAVSAGAEVLADGNIHIYGALRGRALAGVKGDESARIFCTSQEAELVSIAGHFLVDDQLKSNHWQSAVQVYLADDSVCIRPLN